MTFRSWVVCRVSASIIASVFINGKGLCRGNLYGTARLGIGQLQLHATACTRGLKTVPVVSRQVMIGIG